MGFWDTIKGVFTGGPSPDYEAYFDPAAPDVPAYTAPIESWFPKVPEAGYDQPVTSQDWKGSLWEGFKTVVSTGATLFEKYLEATPDKSAIVYNEPRRGLLGDRQDYRVFTPYPRASSGTTPAIVSAPGGGISPTILIIGAGLLFLMMKKKGR